MGLYKTDSLGAEPARLFACRSPAPFGASASPAPACLVTWMAIVQCTGQCYSAKLEIDEAAGHDNKSNVNNSD